MSERKASHLFNLIVVLLFALGTVQFAVAQNSKQPDDKETLQQLLTEVRLLRQALQTLERMSLDTYRSQLMVERVRVNREDVRRLSGSLAETRDMLNRTQRAIPTTIEQTKLLESQVALEVDPKTRAQLEFELKRAKDGVEMYKSQVDLLREREQQLSSELRTEQSKLDDLESRLDSLERAIENDRQRLETDKPASGKKP